MDFAQVKRNYANQMLWQSVCVHVLVCVVAYLYFYVNVFNPGVLMRT